VIAGPDPRYRILFIVGIVLNVSLLTNHTDQKTGLVTSESQSECFKNFLQSIMLKMSFIGLSPGLNQVILLYVKLDQVEPSSQTWSPPHPYKSPPEEISDLSLQVDWNLEHESALTSA